MPKEREVLTSPLTGQTIFEHYDHEIVVANYSDGLSYSLECEFCYEVLCWSENPRTKLYKILKDLYQRQSNNNNNFKLHFGRIGGRYGTLYYTDDDNDQAVDVLTTRYLI